MQMVGAGREPVAGTEDLPWERFTPWKARRVATARPEKSGMHTIP